MLGFASGGAFGRFSSADNCVSVFTNTDRDNPAYCYLYMSCAYVKQQLLGVHKKEAQSFLFQGLKRAQKYVQDFDRKSKPDGEIELNNRHIGIQAADGKRRSVRQLSLDVCFFVRFSSCDLIHLSHCCS